jgi:hypothetical protein
MLTAFLVGTLVCTADAQAPTPGQLTPAAPQTPSRAMPARERPLKGTAVLRGFVVGAETGKPIRRARVSANGAGVPRSVQTDADGRFEFTDLTAGKYTIFANKAGLLSNINPEAQRRVQPIELADGQIIEKIVIALSKGGVIAGQVLDEFGDPMTGATVRALRYRYIDGRRQLSQVFNGPGNVTSDDLGQFRLYGLDPGDYYVSATGGRDSMPFGAAPANAEGPADTYYPGTGNPAEARRVTVRAGRETAGVVFPMVVTRLSRVTGRVQTSSGEPFKGSVNVSVRNNGGGHTGFGSPVRPDGSFEIGNLQPGTYELTARPDSRSYDAPITEMARAMVTVNGDDIADLMLIVGPAGVARGRVVTDEGIAPPFAPDSVRISMQPVDRWMPMGRFTATTAKPDWTFEMTGLLGKMQIESNQFSIASGAPTDRWMFKSLLLDGRDVTDTGIDFDSGRVVDNIDLVYTRKLTQFSGTLSDERGSVPAGAWVVLLPGDDAKWTARSRYVRATRPSEKGTYRLTAVPYDDYMIVGVTGLEDGQWADPDFLRAVRDLGTRVSIGEGELKVQNVKVVEWRR